MRAVGAVVGNHGVVRKAWSTLARQDRLPEGGSLSRRCWRVKGGAVGRALQAEVGSSSHCEGGKREGRPLPGF